MKSTRGIVLFLLAALVCGCATSGQLDRSRDAGLAGKKPRQLNEGDMTWYTGGEARLSLKPVPPDMSSTILFAGKTTVKVLMVTVEKDGGVARTNPVPLAADGSFNVRYLIKEGSGTYTVSYHGSEEKNSQSYEGLGFFTHTVKKALPADLQRLELNGKVIAYVDKVLGTSVGRGECWDLAQQALDLNLADWNRQTSFGLTLNPDTDKIKAGDIIQFRTVKITEHLPGGATQWETLGAPDHTAVIYKVLGNKHYTLAHQNIGGKRSVMKSNINLAHVTSGQYWIYRPVALMISDSKQSMQD